MHLDAQIAAMRAALGSTMTQPQPFRAHTDRSTKGENPGAASGEPRCETKMKGDCGLSR
jgi:hypothetical protein